MQEKDYFEGILTSIKNLSGLLLHGSIESSNEDVHTKMQEALKESLDIQHDIYIEMQNNGWYQIENIKDSEIKKALSKQEKSN